MGPHQNMHSATHYITLTIVIIFGVTTANLLSNVITAYAVDLQLTEQSKKLIASFQRSNQKQKQRNNVASENRRRQQEQIKNKRASSTIAARLWQNCKDWEKANAQMPNYTTNQGKLKHCNAYSTYIDTGKAP